MLTPAMIIMTIFLTSVFHACMSRSSCLQMFFKIVVLKKFPKFTGKHLCWSLSLMKLQV